MNNIKEERTYTLEDFIVEVGMYTVSIILGLLMGYFSVNG